MGFIPPGSHNKTRILLMLLTALFLPFLTSLICAFQGRWLGYRGGRALCLGGLSISVLVFTSSWLSSLSVATNSVRYLSLYSWLTFKTISVPVEFLFDSLSLTMAVVVCLISFVVHIYSTDYLREDPHIVRFLATLSLFTFFMLILVSAGNFVQLFFGWEGVGITSYLLINFWHTRVQANKAALKALFLNRIGDLSLLFAIALMVYVFGSIDFVVLATLTPFMASAASGLSFGLVSFSYVDLICFALLGAAIGKSAQLGLHVWLPDAMEGPTPVSALLHAATMVTAGVFLLIRSSFLFEFSDKALFLTALVGALTAFFAATTAMFQYDLKRIIAFSTCSQLGYMFLACGMSGYPLALFHLFNHAFFKALLFLAAGNIIHNLGDEQDLRKMGGLASKLPLTFAFFVIASLSLMGFPFLSGFYSKEIIIELAAVHIIPGHNFFFLLALAAAFGTVAYSYRLLHYVFFDQANFSRIHHLSGIYEPGLHIQAGLVFLALGSIISGYYGAQVFIGHGTTFFTDSIFILPKHYIFIEAEFIPLWLKILPLLGLAGIPFAMHFLLTNGAYVHCLPKTFTFLVFWSRFFNQKWFFDKLYNSFSLVFLRWCYADVYRFVDKGVLELFGPFGMHQLLRDMGPRWRSLQLGLVVQYVVVMFLALLAIYFVVFWF